MVPRPPAPTSLVCWLEVHILIATPDLWNQKLWSPARCALIGLPDDSGAWYMLENHNTIQLGLINIPGKTCSQTPEQLALVFSLWVNREIWAATSAPISKHGDTMDIYELSIHLKETFKRLSVQWLINT